MKTVESKIQTSPLHAFEPGHSKALMAGFIVAIPGTATQAVLLRVSAAVGDTLVVGA